METLFHGINVILIALTSHHEYHPLYGRKNIEIIGNHCNMAGIELLLASQHPFSNISKALNP